MKNTKNQIKTLIDFLYEKTNTITLGEMANVNESIDGIVLRLKDSEEDFPNKNEVIGALNDLGEIMRKTPYCNIVSITLLGLNGVMYFLRTEE